MKFYSVALFLCCWTFSSNGQNCIEFQKHLESIDNTFFPGHIIDRTDTIFNANRAFVDYTVSNLLNKPADKCFISNRNILRKLNSTTCDSSSLIIQDTLKNGTSCKITFTTVPFEINNHQLIYNLDSSYIQKIDGNLPYGRHYMAPKIEIDLIQIEVNGIKIEIPQESYSNFYNPNVCGHYGFIRPVEVYESLNGEYLYLYIYGGNATGTYFTKLVFNQTKYITTIVTDYYPLNIHSSFRESFIGF
jgi:hypothetical protein